MRVRLAFGQLARAKLLKNFSAANECMERVSIAHECERIHSDPQELVKPAEELGQPGQLAGVLRHVLAAHL